MGSVNVVPVGCWIDGHWGRFCAVRLVQIAMESGWSLDDENSSSLDRLLAEVNPYGPDAQASDWEALLDQGGLADQAEEWLNDNVAPEGLLFGWHDGEFFLWPAHVWHEEDPTDCGCTAERIAAAQRFLSA